MTESIAHAIGEYWPSYRKRKDQPRRQGKIYPSTLVLGCDLTCYYDLTHAEALPENRDPESMIIMDIGTFLHDNIQEGLKNYYEDKGWMYLDEQRLRFSENSSGRLDALAMPLVAESPEGEIELHEYKSIGKSGFDKLGKDPKPDNVEQASLYCSRTEAKKIRIVYICRDNGRRKEYLFDYDPEVAKRMQDKIDAIEEAAIKGEPPKANPGWIFTAHCFKVCPYREVCPEAVKGNNRKI